MTTTLPPTPAPTPSERWAAGKARRAATPRSSLADFAAPDDRPDPVGLLVEQGRSRLADLLPLRYSRMTESAFSFYRGAALIMACDLATAASPGIEVQLCGDAHLSNFGIYGTPERRLVFDINDFDETARGPFEWDVKRLAASVEIAGRDRGFDEVHRTAAVRAVARGYRETMAELAEAGNLDVWYASLDVEHLADDPAIRAGDRKRVQRQIARARGKDNREASERLVHDTPDGPRFAADPPLVVPIEDLTEAVSTDEVHHQITWMLSHYGATLSTDRRELLRSFRPVHMARKVVGVGSVGTRCWIVLLLGRDSSDPLILQVKEASESAIARYTAPSPFRHQGHRVVAGQKLMQAASDVFLGWDRVEHGLDGASRDFYVRQLRDWKGSVEIERLTPGTLRRYALVCGQTLARAHARSGDRIAIAGYLGSAARFDDAMARFAQAYATQNQRDFEALRAAVASGALGA